MTRRGGERDQRPEEDKAQSAGLADGVRAGCGSSVALGAAVSALVPVRTDQAELINAICASCNSPHTQRAYAGHLQRFVRWWADSGDGLNRDTVLAWRASLESAGAGPASINQALTAIKKLARESFLRGGLDDLTLRGVEQIDGAKIRGNRAGNWLTKAQARELWAAGNPETLIGQRDRAIVATLMGCALRRAELVSLSVAHLQHREGRPVIVDLTGKGGKVRTVPMPIPVYERVRGWIEVAHIAQNAVYRGIGPAGDVSSRPMDESTVWLVVTRIAKLAGVSVSPHDLRRTAARLMYEETRDLIQVQLVLGHESPTTTKRYIGLDQPRLREAVNDDLGIW